MPPRICPSSLVAGMSCSSQPPRPESPDSSDYGSDFTPDEEAVLNELLIEAVAAHTAINSDAGPTQTSTSDITAAPVTVHANTAVTSDPGDLASLPPAALDALVADIEDVIEDPPGVRLPKVLGREKPRSLWRQASQRPFFGTSVVHGAGRPNRGPHSDRAFGMIIFISFSLGRFQHPPRSTVMRADTFISEAFSRAS